MDGWMAIKKEGWVKLRKKWMEGSKQRRIKEANKKKMDGGIDVVVTTMLIMYLNYSLMCKLRSVSEKVEREKK